jgi:hypothetical protein
MFRYLILVSAVLFSANALAATSKNLIVDRGLFVDQTGTVDITEATRADYRPFTQTLNRSLKKNCALDTPDCPGAVAIHFSITNVPNISIVSMLQLLQRVRLLTFMSD